MGLAFVIMVFSLFVTCLAYLWTWHVQTTKYETLVKRYNEVHKHVHDELETEYHQRHQERLSHMRQVVSQEHAQLVSQKHNPNVQGAASWLRNECASRFSDLDKQLRGDIIATTEERISDICNTLNQLVWGALQQYKEQADGGYNISPANCRVAYTEGNRTVVLMEQVPTTRRVMFLSRTGHPKGKMPDTPRNGYRQYNLAFPYIYYFMIADNGTIHTVSVYFSNKAIQRPSDLLHILPFPNVEGADRYSRICMGTSFAYDGTIYQQAQKVIELFWMQCFGTHGSYTADKTGHSSLRNLATWESASEKDPSFVLNVPWRNGHTVDSIIRHAMARRDKTSIDRSNVDLQKTLDQFTKSLHQEIKAIVEKRKAKFKAEKVELSLTANAEKEAKSLLQKHVTECVSAFQRQCTADDVAQKMSQKS